MIALPCVPKVIILLLPYAMPWHPHCLHCNIAKAPITAPILDTFNPLCLCTKPPPYRRSMPPPIKRTPAAPNIRQGWKSGELNDHHHHCIWSGICGNQERWGTSLASFRWIVQAVLSFQGFKGRLLTPLLPSSLLLLILLLLLLLLLLSSLPPFHLPSSIFHLPSSIFPLPSSLFPPPSSHFFFFLNDMFYLSNQIDCTVRVTTGGAEIL